MVIKSKFIKGIWFIEVPNETESFNITTNAFLDKPALIVYGKEQIRTPAINIKPILYDSKLLNSIMNFKNPKGLFLTKLATENDWEQIVEEEHEDHYWYGFKDYTVNSYEMLCNSIESGLSLLKAEGLDYENKNYLVVKEEI